MFKKIFIKNYQDTDDVEVRNKYGLVAGLYGVISNIILGIIKLIIGFISNSVSIMSDAVNNLSDSFSSLVTIVGFKLVSKKPTKEHPYGYARYEYVAGFVIALMMLIMGVLFVKESILKIINPEELTINFVTYLVLILAILTKLSQMFIYNDFSKSIDSATLKANAIDSRNDIINTSAILLSMIIMSIFDINIDAYVGLIVSILVIVSSTNTLKETLQPIIGIVPTKEQVDEVKKKLLSYDVVKGIHDLVIHNYGVNNDFITVHCEVDSRGNIVETHDLIDNIERDFREELGIALTIHMDPIVIGDKKIDKLKDLVTKTLTKFDKELMLHDFRVVEGKTHTNILFDVVVPYEKEYTEEEIIKYLKDNIKSDTKYYYVIEIDHPFI